MSPRAVPPPGASDALTPDPAPVARFRADLARFCDPDRVRLLVAVSGGPDSLALLLLAQATLGERCSAATVDHGVRPEAADEAAFVARLCAERGIPHHILTNPEPDGDAGGNISAKLRLIRYSVLKVELQEAGADLLATAHHLDDQVETLLMRMNRGAGVAGMAGVRERNGPIVRPLLGWRRVELAAVVESCGLTAVADPSNVDDRYDRARLRKQLAETAWLDPLRIAQSARALADAEKALAWMTEQASFRHLEFPSRTEAALTPATLPFEILRRLVEQCLRHLDPRRSWRGGEVANLASTLERGGSATLGGVLATAERGDRPVWRFRPAPPHRA